MKIDETVYSNQIPCPYDGRDLYAEWEASEPCEHLIADWSDDPNDNGGGVLGEGIGGRELPANIWELARVCWDLYDAAPSADEDSHEGWQRQLAALRSSFPDAEPPAWWPNLCQSIWDKLPDARPAEDSPEFGALATDIMPSCIQQVDGIIATSAVLGDMTSGTSWFLWSNEPDGAREEIATCLDRVTSQLRSAIRSLQSDTDAPAPAVSPPS